MFVAVVLPKDNESRLPSGDMRCFVHDDKDEAISAALDARDKWMVNRPHRAYYVAVGELVEVAKPKRPKRKFRLQPIVKGE